MQHIFTLNDEHHIVNCADDLTIWLEKVRQLDRADISLYQVVGSRAGLEVVLCRIFGATTEIGGKVLMAWFNDQAAYVIFEEDDDQSFHSYNPSYSGNEDDEVLFFLGGQEEDMSPVNWCIPREEALKAVMHFYECGDRPNWIHWQKG